MSAASDDERRRCWAFLGFVEGPLQTGLFLTLAVGGLLLLVAPGCEYLESAPDVPHSAGSGEPSSTQVEGPVAQGPFTWEDPLRVRIDQVLELTRRRHLQAGTNAAWQTLHGVLVFGRDLEIYDHQGQLVSAIDYLLDGGLMQGWNLRPGDKGVRALLESGSKTGQGHKDQWLGYLSLSPCQFPPTHPIAVGDQQYTIADLVHQAQWECRDGMEASWTVMGLSVYLKDLHEQWTSGDGDRWTLERLVALEAQQDLTQSACGGTHRLVGLCVAVNRFREEHPDQELTGGWQQAQDQIDWAVQQARQFQHPSGAFSTSYFQRPGHTPDAQTLLGTTGHTLEFLCYALSEEELRQPWLRQATDYLVGLFEKTQQLDLECGALYHAAAGLAVYRQRAFQQEQLISQ